MRALAVPVTAPLPLLRRMLSLKAAAHGRPSPRLLVVQPRQHPLHILRAKLVEALRLAEALGTPRADARADKESGTPWTIVQGPRVGAARWEAAPPRAGAFFGRGTVENVRAHLQAASSKGQAVDVVFVNAALSGVQQRNLQAAWGKDVLDRVGLIIEIFGAHAQTRAAKLQVELAALEYKKSRLVREKGDGGRRSVFGFAGEQQVVSGRGRASPGRGFLGGAGESELHLQRQRLTERQVRLKNQLEEVRRTRALHRAARQRRTEKDRRGGGLPVVAVVGYTNAGKSSLVAALSGQQGLHIDNRLFATLDPRVRGVVLPSGRKVLLSDTVGFIRDLPVELVEAFQATLEEVVEADLLLHVVDASAADRNEQRAAVMQVLTGLGYPINQLATCTLEAWNKVDLLTDQLTTADKVSSAVAAPLHTGFALENWVPNVSEGTRRSGEEEEAEAVARSATAEELRRRASDEWGVARPSRSVKAEAAREAESRTCGADSNTCTEDVFRRLPWESAHPATYHYRYSHRGMNISGILGLEKVPKVATSALNRTGLGDLLLLIDKRLQDKGR